MVEDDADELAGDDRLEEELEEAEYEDELVVVEEAAVVDVDEVIKAASELDDEEVEPHPSE